MIELREFTIPRTPPSKNDPDVKTIRARGRSKQEWQALVIAELEALDLPRPIPSRGPLNVFITLRFASNRGQEAPNYRFIEEVVGDALMGGHPNSREGETFAGRSGGPFWIVNDKDEHWTPHLAINKQRPSDGERRSETTVRLLWLPVHLEVYDAAA